jgi:hypothetical protein
MLVHIIMEFLLTCFVVNNVFETETENDELLCQMSCACMMVIFISVAETRW